VKKMILLRRRKANKIVAYMVFNECTINDEIALAINRSGVGEGASQVETSSLLLQGLVMIAGKAMAIGLKQMGVAGKEDVEKLKERVSSMESR
jgi:hypothetical protein